MKMWRKKKSKSRRRNQMTKQEYMDKLNAAWFSGARCGKLKAATEIKDEYIASLEAENAALTLLHTQATDQMIKMQNRAHELEAENAKLEKLNSAAVERLAYHACPSVPSRNNYGQPCNDSDDCVACWREYLGGKDE
jgi:predicted nuclease with TOPRIM domain